MRTPRRRLPDETKHDYHHFLIGERASAFAAISRRVVDRHRRREEYKRVTSTLASHLRGEHGWHRLVGPPLSLDELHAIHVSYHTHQEIPASHPSAPPGAEAQQQGEGT